MIETKRHVPATPDSFYIANDEARVLFEEAYEEHMNGHFDNAINGYKRSLEVAETAPAYTYMAWAHSALGQLDKAIDLCKKAIDLDPDYGNPYNDIGAYLLHMGKDDEAIHWLERAIVAPKYDCKFFPYFNLGRIYQNRNMVKKALSCFRMALEVNPDFKQAAEALDKVENSLN